MARTPNILVVEDENIIAMDIQNKLKRLGYAVSGLVSSGEEAIRSAGQLETDLVLMDIMLKGEMDGIEAAQQIRSKYDIPVVYLTAYKDENTLKRAKITGPFGYLLKPFMVGELHTTIEMALNKHEMEANLKKSEQWLAMTLNSMGDAVIATDASANLTFMNPIAQDMTGCSQHDVLGKPLMEVLNIYDEDTGQPSECPIDEVLSDGVLKVDSFHYILVSDSGRELVVTCTLAPMKNENDEVTGAVLVLRDITRQRKMERELKQTRDGLEDRVEERTLELAKSNEELRAEIVERQRVEKDLRDSEERYRILIQHTYDLITEVDGLGNILYISPNLFEILGYENSELEGKSIFELVDPDDCVHLKPVFQRITQDLSSAQEVLKYKHKNGEWKTLECTGKAYTAANGQVRTIIAARDITRKIRIEEELVKAQKVESLGVLAGGIAHDFNNILTTVLGHISLTMMDLNPDDISMVSLKEAEEACLRAKELTSQLVTFAQGGTDLERVESSLEGIIKDSTKLAVSGSNIDVEYNFENGVWNVEINEDQINQVVFNLVLNSVQAMPSGGVISIGVENGNLEVNDLVPFPEGRYVRVSFKDNGVGIPKEIVSQIFDPFFSTKKNGCGLGLALVYSIVKNHGGYLEVDSEVGSGTTINLHLPAKQA